MTETFLTINEAAKIMKVHPNTIRNLLNRGELKAQRVGTRIIRIYAADLQEILSTYTRNEKNV